MKQLSRPASILLGFIGINILWRLVFLGANQGAYTDGILQIDMFRLGASFWPPLYALLTRLLSWIPGLGLEGAGRLVSLICGVLVLGPLLAIARRLFGLRAAFWALAAWTATPLALQWSLQVMTDMPFTLFWMATLAALIMAVEGYLPGLFPQGEAAATADPKKGAQWLTIASVCGALSTLTRYQGIFLLPPLVLAAWRLARVGRTLAGRAAAAPWLALLPWVAVPAGLFRMLSSLLVHGRQISERTGLTPWDTLVNYWDIFENFLLKSPYFMTYGIFGFFIYGLFRIQWSTARLRWAGWLSLYLALGILGLQAVFLSFQARYLLPLLPLACLYAGHGLATWERHTAGHPLRRWGLMLPALGWGLFFSAMVGVYQGNPFKDVKEASLYVRGLNLPEGRRVFANEIYNPAKNLYTIKTGFWTGRAGGVLPLGAQPLRPGDILIISSRDAGGMAPYHRLLADLQQLPARRLGRPFSRVAYPLITDLMQEAGTEQNPLAFVYRYRRQVFETSVLEVLEEPKPTTPLPGSEPLKPIPPLQTGPAEETLKKLKDLENQIKELKEIKN